MHIFGKISFKQALENGRSMVEMIGVLAIIGVLSMTAIAGFMWGMNRYQAGQLVDVCSKVAVAALTNEVKDAQGYYVAHLSDITDYSTGRSLGNVTDIVATANKEMGQVEVRFIGGTNPIPRQGVRDALKSLMASRYVDDVMTPVLTFDMK